MSEPVIIPGRRFDIEGTTQFLKGVFIGGGMQSSLSALGYATKRHCHQTRDDGQLYIVHPLTMASYAVSLNDSNITDDTYATILLHDVCEEVGLSIEELPFNPTIRRGVKYMTKTKFHDETSYELRRRYFNELLESKDAVICKAIDRFNNLSTMQASFEPQRIRKNVVETDLLLLPSLKKAKEKWPELSNLLQCLISNIRSLNDLYAIMYKVQLSDTHFVNVPDATDYSHLITGEKPAES